MNFQRNTAAVLQQLDDDRAFQEWKASGGLDRLKSVFDSLSVHSFKHPDDWDESVWSVGKAVSLRKHTEPTDRPRTDHVANPFETGRGVGCSVGPLADCDDSNVYDIEETPLVRLARQRHAVMCEIMDRDTGNAVSEERANEAVSRHEELKRQNLEIARRLESVGMPVFRSTPFSVYRYFVHSGTVTKSDQFRRIMFLPLVAQKVRRPKLIATEFFCQKEPFARMWTFTSGPRTPLPELREKIAWFHRRISKFAAWLREKHSVEMVLRCTELGTPEHTETGSVATDPGSIERDAAGVPNFHVHAHCLVRSLTGWRDPDDWKRLLRKVWRRWSFHWDEGRSVQDPRELVKYMCKPSAVLGLEPTELLELARQLERLRMVVPMGSLRVEIKDRRERCLSLDRQPTPDGPVWREVFDWNRWAKRRKPTDPVDEAREAVIRWKPKTDRIPTTVVARLAPAFAPGSTIAEPSVVVLAAAWNPAEIVDLPMVAELRERTADAWARARAAGIRVHVCTSTVPDLLPGAVDWVSRRPPDRQPRPEPAEILQ